MDAEWISLKTMQVHVNCEVFMSSQTCTSIFNSKKICLVNNILKVQLNHIF